MKTTVEGRGTHGARNVPARVCGISLWGSIPVKSRTLEGERGGDPRTAHSTGPNESFLGSVSHSARFPPSRQTSTPDLAPSLQHLRGQHVSKRQEHGIEVVLGRHLGATVKLCSHLINGYGDLLPQFSA